MRLPWWSVVLAATLLGVGAAAGLPAALIMCRSAVFASPSTDTAFG